MPDVARGFTHDRDPGGVPRDAERAKIQQQLEASHGVAGDGVVASADEIKRSMLAAEGWRANISTGDPDENAREQAQIEQFAGEGQRLLARDAERDAKLAQYERQPVIEDAQAAFLGLGYGDDENVGLNQAIYWDKLTAEERAQFVNDGFIDVDDIPHLDAVALEARGLLRHAARVDAAATAKRLDDTAKAAVYASLLREAGFLPNSPQAIAWTNDMRARTAARGVDLDEISARDFEAEFRAEDALAEEERVAHAEARFKASILGEASGDVMSGITVLGPDGQHVPIQPRGEIYVRPNVERAIARSIGQPSSSAAAIREGVGGVDPKTREHRALQSQAGKLFEAARSNTGR